METIFDFIMSSGLWIIIVPVLLLGYEAFVLWRCKRVYEQKSGFWILPIWAILFGGMMFLYWRSVGIKRMREHWHNVNYAMYIIYEDHSPGMLMAILLVYTELCEYFFALQKTERVN